MLRAFFFTVFAICLTGCAAKSEKNGYCPEKGKQFSQDEIETHFINYLLAKFDNNDLKETGLMNMEIQYSDSADFKQKNPNCCQTSKVVFKEEIKNPRYKNGKFYTSSQIRFLYNTGESAVRVKINTDVCLKSTWISSYSVLPKTSK